MLPVLLLYMIIASTFTLSKAALAVSQPIFFAAIRLLGAGALLYLYQKGVCKDPSRIARKEWKTFIVLMLTQSYIAYVADLWALQYMSSITSAFMYNLSPFIAALFSYLLFKERLSIRQVLGLFIGFSSLVPVLMTTYTAKLSPQLLSFTWPDIAMLSAVAASAFGWVLMRKLVRAKVCTVEYINSVSMLGGGFAALATSFWVEAWHITLPVTNWSHFALYTVLMILIAHIIFFNFYGYLLKRYTATLLSFAGFTASLWASLFGWLFLGEHITWQFFVSAAMVFVGLYLFYKDELKQVRRAF